MRKHRLESIMKLKPSEIKENPNNPRFIKDNDYKELVQSIKDFPEMSEVREVVINMDNVILGGNMRFKAMVEAGWKEIPVRQVDWPQEKQEEFVIKDNKSAGAWDWEALANKWDSDKLEQWGVRHNDWQTDFSPSLEPTFDTKDTTDEQIEKKAKELAQQMIKQKSNISTMCPSCGEEFEVQI